MSALTLAGGADSAQEHAGFEVLTPNFQVMAVGEERAAVEAARYPETLDRRFRALGFRPTPWPSSRVRVLLLSEIEELAPYATAGEEVPRHSGLFVPGVGTAGPEFRLILC